MRIHIAAGVAALFAVAAAHAQEAAPAAPPLRVMLRARSGGADRLDPLRYIGGFETKTLLYETLVQRGPDGRIEPALASAWTFEDEGRAVRFTLRDGAKFHDGAAVTAADVVAHFRRWVGDEEHDWLPVNRHIVGVEAVDPRTFVVRLDEPFALLDDLCAINPCAIVGGGARDWEGEFTRPVGTGPFRFTGVFDAGRRWRLSPVDGQGCELEISFVPRGRDTRPIDALQNGDIDCFVGGWDEDLPAERLDELATDPRFVVQLASGSSVVMLTFRVADGPTADVDVRRRIAAAVDRQQLIDDVEGGRAEPCAAWAAPSVACWPRGKLPRFDLPPLLEPIPLRIAAGRRGGRSERVVEAVAAQLRRAGFAVEVLRTSVEAAEPAAVAARNAVATVAPLDEESGEVRAQRNRRHRLMASRADVRVELTYGVPYDPFHTLAARFGVDRDANGDQPRPFRGVDPRLRELVQLAMHEPDERARLPLYARLQALMDEQALLVPLYVPNRVALRRVEVDGVGLGLDAYRVDLRGLRRVER